MDSKDREARIRLFLQLIESFKAESWVDNIYEIIKNHDMPKHMDRDFVLSALEQYYVKKEMYERCAELVKWKEDPTRKDLKKSKKASKESKEEDSSYDYEDGFKVPDSIRGRFKSKRKK